MFRPLCAALLRHDAFSWLFPQNSASASLTGQETTLALWIKLDLMINASFLQCVDIFCPWTHSPSVSPTPTIISLFQLIVRHIMLTAPSKNCIQKISLLAGFFSVWNCHKPSHLASVVEMHVCLYLFHNRLNKLEFMWDLRLLQLNGWSALLRSYAALFVHIHNDLPQGAVYWALVQPSSSTLCWYD